MKSNLLFFFIFLHFTGYSQSAASSPKKISIYSEYKLEDDDLLKSMSKTVKQNDKAVAVIIGNRKYQNGISEVQYANADAKITAKFIENILGYKRENIFYYEDATLSSFKSLFGDKDNIEGKISDAIIPGESELFIYYSGHGSPDPSDNSAYLMPVDSDPYKLPLTGFKLETLYRNINMLPIKKATIVIDACFSGSTSNNDLLIKNASPIGVKVKKTVVPFNQNIAIITAGTNDQVASWFPEKAHGLLTYFLVKGLTGEADANKDKKINLQEIKNWITDKQFGVPYYARKLYSRIQEPEIIGLDDFIIK